MPSRKIALLLVICVAFVLIAGLPGYASEARAQLQPDSRDQTYLVGNGPQNETETPTPKLVVVSAVFSPTHVGVGELLSVQVTVRNDGDAEALTQGPDPGFEYTEGETFDTAGYPRESGDWRVAVNHGATYPFGSYDYRWGLGSSLAPGESATVNGYIRLSTEQIEDYWVGIIQEDVGWHDEGAGRTAITVGNPNTPTPTLTPSPTLTPTPTVTVSPTPSLSVVSAKFSPATLHQGELLSVEVTVKNNGSGIAYTQGPDPGFVYEEGDTFDSVGYPRQTGTWRIAVNYGESYPIGLYPYRWGLGAPLPPGETVTVRGYVRLETLGTQDYWVGIIQEDIGWHEEGTARTSISVLPPNTPTPTPTMTSTPTETPTPIPTAHLSVVKAEFSPTWLYPGQLLVVDVMVKNIGETIAVTQGPDPGFVYEEGETFDSAGFPLERGKCRVGVNFGSSFPFGQYIYRWGLGSPLAPGDTVTIRGYVRLQSIQSQSYWVGAVQEEMGWYDEGTGQTMIHVIEETTPTPTFTPTITESPTATYTSSPSSTSTPTATTTSTGTATFTPTSTGTQTNTPTPTTSPTQTPTVTSTPTVGPTATSTASPTLGPTLVPGTWVPSSSGTEAWMWPIQFIGTIWGQAAGADGIVLSTTDAGTSWSTRSTGGPDIHDMHFVNRDWGWSVGRGYIGRTTDGGLTWQQQYSGANRDLLGVFALDEDHAWVVGESWIHGTIDGGATWQAAQMPLPVASLQDVFFTDERTGWIVGWNGTILKSVDAGTTWQKQDSGTREILEGVQFVDSVEGWAIGHGGVILHTLDGGANWTRQASSITATLYGLNFYDRRTGWAAGEAGTIMVTADGGTSWWKETSGVATTLQKIAITDPCHVWVAGKGGVILRRYSGSISCNTRLPLVLR